MSLPERMDLGVAVTSPTETVGDKSIYHTTAGWINNTTPERKKDKYVVTSILDIFVGLLPMKCIEDVQGVQLHV